jgi:PhoH-like ATPase
MTTSSPSSSPVSSRVEIHPWVRPADYNERCCPKTFDQPDVALGDAERDLVTDLAHQDALLASDTRTRVVLDTSVLIADPSCLHDMGEVDLVIPLTVIEELDGLKSRPDDVGRAARVALRSIEDLRMSNGGSLASAVPLGRGSLQIEINGVRGALLAEHGLDPNKPDNRIIGAALGQADIAPTVMVSNDAALRIKAAHLGLSAIEHRPSTATRPVRPSGWRVIDVDHRVIDDLYSVGRIDIDDLALVVDATPTGIERSLGLDEDARLRENEFLVLRSGSQSALARRRGDDIVLLSHSTPEPWGLHPRNKEQRFALELLLDPDVTVVALDGRAGTGKTILAIAAALEQVVEESRYERLAVYRPLVPVGRADVGFLPGGLDEKLDPWMSAIHDAVVALTDRRSAGDARRLVDELTDRQQLSLESVTFLRGRSLQQQMVVIDEAQNLEPTTLRTILTRVGEGTKVIFTGDTSQIDAPYLGETNNALTVLTSAFTGQPCFGHITLQACERSGVASLAAELL